MSFNAALVSGNYTSLRGSPSVPPHYQGKVFVSLCPNTTVYSARVNQSTFSGSFAQVTYDGGSGTLANVRADQTILFSRTNDPKAAYHVGRIRATPTSSIFYINQTSAAIADNDYIFVLDDYRLWDVLPRDVSGVIKMDYDINFRQLRPIIYNLKSAYAGRVASGVLTLSLAPLAVAATSGATISTWAWSVGDGTITVGSSSTQNITVTFPEGFRHIHLTVTDNGGRTMTRHIPVWAHSAAYPPQLLTHGALDVSKALDTGADATLTAYAELAGVLDNTLLMAWGDETYNGTPGTITGDNILFLGRLRQSSDSYSVEGRGPISEARLTIEGPLTQMGRIEQRTFEALNKASPTLWGQVKDLTIWRLCWLLLSELTTFGSLYSLAFDSTSTTFLSYGLSTAGGNIFASVNDIADRINAAMQMNPTGMMEIVRDARIIDTGDRTSLVTVANWVMTDIISLQGYEHDHVKTVGRVDGSGGSYNTTLGKESPAYLSVAPGVTQDYAEGQVQLTKQTLAANQTPTNAQAELNRRTGHAFARAQNPDRISVTHPDGYHWLQPSRNQWYTFTTDGSETVSGYVLTTATRWLLESVTVSHNAQKGTKDVTAIYVRETSGAPGQAPPLTAVTEAPLVTPTYPPFPIMPPFQIDLGFALPDVPTDYGIPAIILPSSGSPRGDGNTVLLASASRVDVAYDFIGSDRPEQIEITPPSPSPIVAAMWEGRGKRGAYAFTQGDNTNWCIEWDFAAGQQGWVGGDFQGATTGPAASYNSGGGYWERATAGGGSLRSEMCIISRSFSYSGFITRIEVDINPGMSGINKGLVWKGNIASWVPVVGPNNNYPGFSYDDFGALQTTLVVDLLTAPFTPLVISSGITLGITNDYPGSGAFGNLDNHIFKVRLYGTDDNPFPELDCGDPEPGPGTGTRIWYTPDAFARTVVWTKGEVLQRESFNAIRLAASGALYAYSPLIAGTQYSIDKGLSFADTESAGASPGAAGGIATQKSGSVVLVGSDDQIKKATSGGTYANYGSVMPTSAQPTALFIPRYQFFSTSSGNTGASPEVLVASAILSSNAGLWRVTAGGNTFTDITPVIGGQYGKAAGANCLAMPWVNGSTIAAVLTFNTTRHLVISLDGGANWVDAGALSSDAGYIRLRDSDKLGQQAFLTDGEPVYVPNIKLTSPTLVSKAYTGTDPVLSIEPYEG